MKTINVNGVEYVAVDEFAEFNNNQSQGLVSQEHSDYVEKLDKLLLEHVKGSAECVRVDGVKYVHAYDFALHVENFRFGNSWTVHTIDEDQPPRTIVIGGVIYVNGDYHQHFAKDYKILKDHLEHIANLEPEIVTLPDGNPILNYRLSAQNALMLGGTRTVE